MSISGFPLKIKEFPLYHLSLLFSNYCKKFAKKLKVFEIKTAEKSQCENVMRKVPKSSFPFLRNMNLCRAGYNSPQKLNVFLQEIEIRICKKFTIFLHGPFFSGWPKKCTIFGSSCCTFFQLTCWSISCHPIVGGNLLWSIAYNTRTVFFSPNFSDDSQAL